MKIFIRLTFAIFVLTCIITACNGNNPSENNTKTITLKGLYSYGPEVKSFIDCEDNREFWVADSAKTLELAYANLGFEKPYTPVYVELEGNLVKSDTTTVTGGYDSTLVVTKLIKISKQIPDGPCLQ